MLTYLLIVAPYLLALQGMAVVAPDYAGLGFDHLPSGTPVLHPWLTGPAQALDLANAILAARAAFPASLPPTGPFVAVGHSEGGGATWSLAEHLVDHPIEGYLGTVAMAPPTRTVELLERALQNPSLPFAPIILSAQPKLAAAITAIFPAYNYSAMTPWAYDRWHNVLKPLQGCLPTDIFAFLNPTNESMVHDGWTDDDTVRRFAELAETGRKKFRGPLLVIAGQADGTVPAESIEEAVDDTCDMMAEQGWDESLEFFTYGGVNHFPVIQSSSMKWLTWVKARFLGDAGVMAASGCNKTFVPGFRTDFTTQSITPNFLLDWVSADEMWKLAK